MLAAKGRHDSRCFTFLLMIFAISGSRASPIIERLPRARGPYSLPPWNQPTIFPPTIRRAVSSVIAEEHRAEILSLYFSIDAAISFSEYALPSDADFISQNR